MLYIGGSHDDQSLRQLLTGDLDKTVILLDGDGNVKVIIPGNKALMPHRADRCAADRVIGYIIVLTDSGNDFKDVQYSLL